MMHVKHGASVLVTDGRKALFLRNDGDAQYLSLRLVCKWEAQLPRNRELKTDAPGRVFSSREGSVRRSSYEETDFHQQAEELFAKDLANFLQDQWQEKAVGELVIVAPPGTLGLLRRDLRDEVSDLIIAEIHKDLVKHPIGAIERLLMTYKEHA